MRGDKQEIVLKESKLKVSPQVEQAGSRQIVDELGKSEFNR